MANKSRLETGLKKFKEQLKKAQRTLHNYRMQIQVLEHKINAEETHITMIREQMEDLCMDNEGSIKFIESKKEK